MIKWMLRQYHLKSAMKCARKMEAAKDDKTFKRYSRIWGWHMDCWGRLAPTDQLIEMRDHLAQLVLEMDGGSK